MLVEMIAAGQSGEAIEMVIALLATLREQNTKLELDRMRLLRKHLGQTSERMKSPQLDFLLSLLDNADPAESTAAEAAAPGDAPSGELKVPPVIVPKGKGGRKPLPEHLPRTDLVHPIPDEERACPRCGADRICIGHEVSEILEIEPAQFRVERHLREKVACKECEQSVETAPAPEKVIPKGRPGPTLLAHVMISKYADHLPLTRQHKIYLREGVEVSVSTMAEWVAAVHKVVLPLAQRCAAHALAAHVLQADDTGIKVLDQDSPSGAKKGHLWCYVGDATWAAFDYTTTWAKEGPHRFLRDRRGWLVADAYRGYDAIFSRKDATAVEVGCWAHARRRFVELAQAGDARAAPMVKLIAQLYEIERDATTNQLSADERAVQRRERGDPLLMEIGRLCAHIINTMPPKDELTGAAGYIVNQWDALRRFVEDGRLPLDNTLVERALRPIAIGRKNYLFCGSDAGAERAASMYTLLGTCALVGAEPRAYLVDILRKLELERWPMKRIDELLPPNWIKTAPASARVAPRQ